MPLHRSALFTPYAACSAQFAEVDGWIVAAHCRTVEEEVAATRRDAAMFDLAGHGSFTLQGPDTLRFANGMFTQNIRDLPEGQACRSALTDEKGKMLGLIAVARTGPEALTVVLDGIAPGDFVSRYGKFIVLDDVEMEDLSEARAGLHLAGPRAGEALAAVGLPVPRQGGAVLSGDLLMLSRDRTGAPGFDLFAPTEALVGYFEALRGVGVMPAGFDAQEWLRISAGQVRWPVDMGERALVHEMGLVASCCSFEKGCYIGQEVINRIDVMGQVNRKIIGLQMDEDAIPPQGAELRLAGSEHGPPGEVVGVARSGARCGGVARVLALARKSAWEPGTHVVVSAAERSVGATVSALPFG